MVRLSEALSLLGLDEDCTLEQLKLSYKQHALRTHPDKNPRNTEATAEFQRVGEAYKAIEAHLEGAKHRSWFRDGFGSSDEDADTEEDDTDIFYDSDLETFEYDYENSDSDSEYDHHYFPPGFMEYLYMFEAINNDRYHCNCSRHREESFSDYQARLKRSREDQIAAEARRTAEAAARKERRVKEREQEQVNAERRRKAKAERKKAKAKFQRKQTEEALRAQHERTQALRSAVFTAARNGNAEGVKSGIWEDGVDAAGGEIKYEEFVKDKPEDTLETLLHIVAKEGDIELFQWLDTHNAEIDQKDSKGYTALHYAVFHGHAPIVKYVFEAYPPQEPEYESVYETPAHASLLYLAIGSGVLEIVRTVLENKLFTAEDLSSGWSWAGQAIDGKSTDILKLLIGYGGTMPLSAPAVDSGAVEHLDEWVQARVGSRDRGREGERGLGQKKKVQDEGVPGRHHYRGRGQGRGRGSQWRGRGRGWGPI